MRRDETRGPPGWGAALQPLVWGCPGDTFSWHCLGPPAPPVQDSVCHPFWTVVCGARGDAKAWLPHLGVPAGRHKLLWDGKQLCLYPVVFSFVK